MCGARLTVLWVGAMYKANSGSIPGTPNGKESTAGNGPKTKNSVHVSINLCSEVKLGFMYFTAKSRQISCQFSPPQKSGIQSYKVLFFYIVLVLLKTVLVKPHC